MIRRSAVWLAIPATVTATCLSMLSGWQRGGWLPERLLWVAIGVVLVVSAHLLPALCRNTTPAARCAGGTLWICCMAAACYGHATFFVLAQQHAGDMRAATVTAPVSIVATGRGLSQIAGDRATTLAQLATVTLSRCGGKCAAALMKRATLAARLDALEVEAAEARRQEVAVDRFNAQQDRVAVVRDAMRADPVTIRMASLLGISAARIELLSGLVFAAVLEGVACLCWMLALHPMGDVRSIAIAAETRMVATANQPAEASATPCVNPDNAVACLAAEIAAGRMRATVADIRLHLRCSQSRAQSLRRQLLARPMPVEHTAATQPC